MARGQLTLFDIDNSLKSLTIPPENFQTIDVHILISGGIHTAPIHIRTNQRVIRYIID
jgi:hypothetical protein